MSFHVTKKFVCTENYPIVDTPKGKLHGYQDNDIFCFHGIDYAHAERFHEAVPTPTWEGVKRAHDYGCGCPEMTYSREGKKDPFELILPQRVWNMSEDVLNLNVWTRSLNPKAKKPVMVWFHGGGFAAGSATHLYSYEGYAMAELYDVVVVSVNHRLNMLGFLDLSEFGEPYRHSANHGVMDLVEALKWVRDNIACFGGDPENVTIYGQSGGGGKVCTLLEMPSADGLYHRAIVQSGVMRGGPRNPNGKEIGRRTVELLGGFTDGVFVSCRAPEDAAPFKAIPDEVDRQGPFGGVYSALRRLQQPLLVLSCDLPFMDGPTLRRLLDARETRLPGTIMTTYQQEETGFIEALVAVYEPACLPWFDAAWEQGVRKFSVVIPEALRTHVPYSRSEALPFFNINYPADFEIARRLAELMRRDGM